MSRPISNTRRSSRGSRSAGERRRSADSFSLDTYAKSWTHSLFRSTPAASGKWWSISLEPTEEGVPIASFRDLSAGKLHALNDRFAERDFVDLHSSSTGRTARRRPVKTVLVERFAALVRDLIEPDPGLSPPLIGQSLSRGLDRPIVGELPLRLLRSVTDAEIQSTLRLCVEQCARLTAEDLAR